MRRIYRLLLHLHPPAFRRQYAGEMLWIFDQATPREGSFSLVLDGFVSLQRQWVLRWGAWKAFAAVSGAIVQIVIATLLIAGGTPPKPSGAALTKDFTYDSLDFSRCLALLVLLLVLCMAGLCFLSRRPIRS